MVEIVYKAAAAKNAAPIKPNPIPTFSAPLPVAAADEEDEVADPVLEAPEDDAPVEVAVVLADAFEEVVELSDLEEDSEADAADVTDAEEAEDEDEAAAEVAAAPVPVEVKTAVRRDPTSPLATQVPATDLLIS